MSKPRINHADWEDDNGHKWSVFKDDHGDASPWIVLPPNFSAESPHWFGDHAAAVRHLVSLGWKK